METVNHIEILNDHIEKMIVKKNSQTINALERLRINYLGKLEMINKQIKKAEANFLNELSKEFEEAIPIDIVVKKPRGRPRKIYPNILSEIIINEVSVDTFEVQLEPVIVEPYIVEVVSVNQTENQEAPY